LSGPAESLILAARLIAPHGVNGLISADSYSDNPGRFQPGAVFLLADGGSLLLEQASRHKGRLLLGFQGVADRNAAERLRGRELFVPEQQAPALPEGSYYHYQILGLKVLEHGVELGVIIDILDYSANDVYVLRRTDGGETLIPALKSVVKRVDPAAGVLEVELPEGL